MAAANENWQVIVNNEVYDTDLESIKQWIQEGRILPNDKVRKGELSWKEAARVPVLKSLFVGETSEAPSSPSYPPVQSAPEQYNGQYNGQYAGNEQYADSAAKYESAGASFSPVLNPAMAPAMAAACHYHPELMPKYICRVCSSTFCQTCPKFVGSSNVPLCPLCGDLCQVYQDVKAKAVNNLERQTDFGFNDFTRALRYPFDNIYALIFAAGIYGFFCLGKEVGGRQSGLLAAVMGYLFLFACTSLVIKQVAVGRPERSFIPDFTTMSYYDDVIMPVLLGIGVSIVTFGPIVVLTVALGFGLFGKPTIAGMDADQAKSNQLTPADMEELRESRDPKKSEEIMRKLQGTRPMQDLGVRSAKDKEKEKEQKTRLDDESNPIMPPGFILELLKGALPVLLVALLGIGWVVFYYPIALAIAGFTQDFWSVMNPLVGIDTIKRMGMNYVKAFLMFLGAQGIWFVLMFSFVVVAWKVVLIPYVGLIVFNVISGVVSFYTTLVIAFVLGTALYKSADRLDIAVD